MGLEALDRARLKAECRGAEARAPPSAEQRPNEGSVRAGPSRARSAGSPAGPFVRRSVTHTSVLARPVPGGRGRAAPLSEGFACEVSTSQRLKCSFWTDGCTDSLRRWLWVLNPCCSVGGVLPVVAASWSRGVVLLLPVAEPAVVSQREHALQGNDLQKWFEGRKECRKTCVFCGVSL